MSKTITNTFIEFVPLNLFMTQEKTEQLDFPRGLEYNYCDYM